MNRIFVKTPEHLRFLSGARVIVRRVHTPSDIRLFVMQANVLNSIDASARSQHVGGRDSGVAMVNPNLVLQSDMLSAYRNSSTAKLGTKKIMSPSAGNWDGFSNCRNLGN
mmetsp:Transcript_38341/g.114790  ORF Transcript_38341/g.114790 Transcript_38341/m.114790 type:complete len:110 (+) Transcript_38341:1949-2278(+)